MQGKETEILATELTYVSRIQFVYQHPTYFLSLITNTQIFKPLESYRPTFTCISPL